MEQSGRRVLVIANETIEAEALYDAVQHSAGGGRGEVLVIAPALNSRIKHWTSDDDEARRAAAVRLGDCLDRLTESGVPAIGYVGDADPLQAITDGMYFFPADEIVVATHPPHRSNWLEQDLIGRACAQFGLPVLHIVVSEVREPDTLLRDAA